MLVRLLPKDAAQEDLFNLYENFLIDIHSGDDVELTLRHFEFDLLDLLGYGLNFDSEINEDKFIDPNKTYSFIPESGFSESKASNFSGKDIINIKNRKLSEVSKKHLKLIAQKAIHFCLDGRDLSSREIFRKIQS